MRTGIKINVLLGVLLLLTASRSSAESLERLPVNRETELVSAGKSSAVILVPDDPSYRQLGEQLASAIEKKCGVRLQVESAAKYVSHRPRLVKREMLDRNFILLGQFWNNAVLERLYCRMFDPTDALYPGPGGYELRTICSPFVNGQNCVVATGSDLEGCRKAVEELPKTIQQNHLPFLHTVHLTGEAAELEKRRMELVKPALGELDKYCIFGHPEAKGWTGEDPHDFPVWDDRNLASAASFGLYYWLTDDPAYAEGFTRIIMSCRKELDRLKQAYREGRPDLMDYSGPELTLTWDLIEHSDAFTDEQRSQITEYLYELACINDHAYYFVRMKDRSLSSIPFNGRHQLGGTSWFWFESEYLLRNFKLTDDQRKKAEEWHAHADRYLQRVTQNPYYTDHVGLIQNEGEQVLRWSLVAGRMDWIENGSLRTHADYWVSQWGNAGFAETSMPRSGTQPAYESGEILNAAGWLYPGEGYQAYRSRLSRWPYISFLYYVSAWKWLWLGWNYYNWELPITDDGLDRLKERSDGLTVITPGKEYHATLQRIGGLATQDASRYSYENIPFEHMWKRIAVRGGLKPTDQYLQLAGMQGAYATRDDANAIIGFDDLGQSLLKPSMSTSGLQYVQGRLGLNTLFVSNGIPGGKQSVTSQLLTSLDVGPDVLLRGYLPRHDGAAWTRQVFLRKQGWMLIADEVKSRAGGDHFLAQNWITGTPFEVNGSEAVARVGDVSLHVVGTSEREMAAAHGGKDVEGVRQKVTAKLSPNQPFTMWTLLYATGPGRASNWKVHRRGPNTVVLVSDDKNPQSIVAFTRTLRLGEVKITADMGVISADHITLAGCRHITIDEKEIYSSPAGTSFGWNLNANSFEAGKEGFGIQRTIKPATISKYRGQIQNAVWKYLVSAGRLFEYTPREVTGTSGRHSVKALSVSSQFKLPTPFSLATVNENGTDELLLYNSDGNPRFELPAFRADPVLVDFDNSGKPDIAFALERAVAVYHLDGTLRWQHEFTNRPQCLSVGDLDGDGRQELGVTLHNYAAVLDAAGKRVMDEEVYRYTGTGGAFGDVDGDGVTEFVAVTRSGVNVLKVGQTRRTVGFASPLGTLPCRVWLRDFDGDGIVELYIGGAGTCIACYDAKKVELKWTFKDAAVRPDDVALLDLDRDGKPEFVAGGGDGFLYVVGADGKFRYSKSVGQGIASLAVVPGNEGESLAVGLEDGRLVLLDEKLEISGEARVGDVPVKHLAVLRGDKGNADIIAADDSGQAIRVSRVEK